MDHFEKIYASKAQEYHEMIRVEDVDNNLPTALNQIASFSNKKILDLGTGTGRIPLLYSGENCDFLCIDLNFPMLLEQARVRQAVDGKWPLVNADNRMLPLRNSSFEIVTAGWAIGHLRGWYPEDWKEQISLILEDMERVAKPGSTLIIMETMTTGGFEPAPPNEELAEYYNWLEEVWGYTGQVIQTDYEFSSVDDAVERTTFFFGEELARMIRENDWKRLPEWTGIWHKTIG